MYSYERHVACILVAICIALTFQSYFQRALPYEKSEQICITVVGAVESTEITVAQGTRVEQVLAKVQMKGEVDLDRLYGMRRLFKAETIVVPYRKGLTLFVEGEVEEPKVIVVDENASASDILAQVDLTENADIRRFLRRRRFRTGTVIQVPTKNR